MRIPDGDLVPARRHRYGGGFGSRRRRRHSRGVVVLVVLLLVAAAAGWAVRRHRHGHGHGAPRVSLGSCPTSAATPAPSPAGPALPANGQVRVVLLNGTPRQGLAHTVAQQLTARGFVVVRADNNPSAVSGASVVTFAAGLEGAATVVARNVAGAQVQASGQAPAGAVELVLGSGFQRLATPQEVAAASRPVVAVPAPTRGACPG